MTEEEVEEHLRNLRHAEIEDLRQRLLRIGGRNSGGDDGGGEPAGGTERKPKSGRDDDDAR